MAWRLSTVAPERHGASVEIPGRVDQRIIFAHIDAVGDPAIDSSPVIVGFFRRIGGRGIIHVRVDRARMLGGMGRGAD